MARPPLPIGFWGEISTWIVQTDDEGNPTKYKSQARYRDHDGHVRPVSPAGVQPARVGAEVPADLVGAGRGGRVRDGGVAPPPGRLAADTGLAHRPGHPLTRVTLPAAGKLGVHPRSKSCTHPDQDEGDGRAELLTTYRIYVRGAVISKARRWTSRATRRGHDPGGGHAADEARPAGRSGRRAARPNGRAHRGVGVLVVGAVNGLPRWPLVRTGLARDELRRLVATIQGESGVPTSSPAEAANRPDL